MMATQAMAWQTALVGYHCNPPSGDPSHGLANGFGGLPLQSAKAGPGRWRITTLDRQRGVWTATRGLQYSQSFGLIKELIEAKR